MVGDFRHGVQDRSNDRTDYKTPEDWIQGYLEAVRSGGYPPPARTRGELLLADEEGILRQHPQWIPGRQGLLLLGLPMGFGRPVDLLPEKEREAMVAAMLEDPSFAAVVEVLLRRAAL